jgi:uncharacterized protein (UPF0548 family)
MFMVRRPSPIEIERFHAQSRNLPLSYAPTGIASQHPRGFDADQMVATIGRGRALFDSARHALLRWAHFQLGWVEVFPPQAPVAPGTVVAVQMRHFGFWSLNGARVLYETGSRTTGTHYGFAYGTLPNHAEMGEELFEVAIDPATETVTYRIQAASRPRAALARLGYPLVRILQARFRVHSAAAMRRAIGGEASRAEHGH